MAENEDDANFEASTPSVTIDLAETRPNTMAAFQSVTPGMGGMTALPPMEENVTERRVISMTSMSEIEAAESLTELMQPLDADPFDEDQAELRFLHSKPTCFVILGKPGAGRTALARRLSQMWRCELVHATDLILQHLDLQTEVGQRLQEILQRGGAIPEEMAARLIEDKINSPEVAHHGYVLDGFPSLSEDYMKVTDQLELVQNWTLKPDFIINLRMPDKDLEARRVGQRVDPATNSLYTSDVWNPDKPDIKPSQEREGEEEEEEDEEEEADEGIGEEEGEEGPREDLSFEIIERLVRRPEDLLDHAQENIVTYKDKMLRMLEDYMADHPQQYLIEMDANKPAAGLFRELVMKLNTFVLRRAAVPIRLQNQDEEDIPEDIETEELMRTLGGTNTVAPRYRWRRSRWARMCPVELQKGNVVPGKPEFAVGFLDKIYVMSSPEAMEKFLKNPRPYLVSPQPRPPCKLCVAGPPLSGKTTMCHLLAHKFNGKVLDLDELIKSRMAVHKAKQVELHRLEALESAVATVKARLREKEETASEGDGDDLDEQEEKEKADTDTDADRPDQELDKSTLPEGEDKQEEEDTGDGTETERDGEGGDSEEPSQSETDKKEGVNDGDTSTIKGSTTISEPAPSQAPTDATNAAADAPAAPTVEVDETHPDVKAMVDAAVQEAEKQTYTLAPEQYVDALEEAVTEIHKELRRRDQKGPIAGGWILDNFPQTREHWTALIDKGLAPDEVVFMKDATENGTYLLKRWYKLNREEVDMKMQERKDEEDREKARVLEEARLHTEKEMEVKKMAEAEERKRQAAEAGEGGEEEEGEAKQEEEGEDKDETGAEKTEPPPDEGEAEPAEAGEEGAVPPITPTMTEPSTVLSAMDVDATLPVKLDEPPPTVIGQTVSGDAIKEVTGQGRGAEEAEQAEEEEEHFETPPPAEDPLPPEGPETTQFRELRNEFDREWPSVQALVTGMLNLEPIVIDIENRNVEELMKETYSAVEQPFSYRPWEYTSIDLDEEEEDAEAEEEDEMEEEEDEEMMKNKKKQFGDSKHFCPVLYRDSYVLWPGNPEIGAKYREKVYYFSSAEAREKFLAEPTLYVAKGQPFKPPPVRLLILGPRGAGKSLHGHYLAEKLGIFHICFKERLQELIIAKSKKKIGPEFDEGEEEPDSEPEEEAEAGAGPVGDQTNPATAPEGESDEAITTEVKEEAEEAEEEEAEIEWTEEEENIKGNLMEEEALTPDTLEKIVPGWWNMEPFKSTGFVLEGFPRTMEEATFMAERGLFPDAAVLLAVEDTDIQGRLLPPKLDKWRQRRDRRLARKERRKLRKKKERDGLINKRRLELVAEVAERKAEKIAQRAADRDSDDSEHSEDEQEDEEEEEDIDALLAEEFEEEEEEEEDEEELEEDAVDRLKNEIGEMYDDDTNKLASVQESLEELLIPRIELNGGRKPHIVRYTLEQNLKPIVDCRESLFEKAYAVKEHIAKKMLQIGYKHPSRFGRWCPAKLLEGDCIQPMQGPGYPSFPSIYRQHIYFLSSPQAREEFTVHPLKYLKQPSPKPVVPIRMAILGPPKSGKTTLANRFVSEYGMVRLSIGEAVRFVLMQQQKSELAAQLNRHLRKGLTIPDELAVQALEVSLLDMRANTRGFVLDSFPVTKRQVDLLTEHSIIPVCVIELQVDSRELMIRGMKDKNSADRILPFHDSAQILAIRIASWQKEITAVREWYKEQHRNWLPLDGDRSKWWVWNRASQEGKRTVRHIQEYLQRISEGKAASVAEMCITPREFLSRLGDFGQYCPVSLARDGQLVDCSVQPTMECAAEFRGRYYKMETPAKLAEFLAGPEQFVPPLAPRPLPTPDLLPRRRSPMEVKTMFPMQLELQGYCPVTYVDGKLRYEAIIPGNPDLLVEYRQNLYCFLSEDKLQTFLRQPEKYYSLKLPHKLPPKRDPLLVTSLPMLGYMEQALSMAITKALTTVGCFKPKFPFLSASRSALVYVAYHLKSYNPRSSDYVRKKYRRKLQQFEDDCELIRYLGSHMTGRYKHKEDRPIDFDHKMIMFLNLKGREPASSALVT